MKKITTSFIYPDYQNYFFSNHNIHCFNKQTLTQNLLTKGIRIRKFVENPTRAANQSEMELTVDHSEADLSHPQPYITEAGCCSAVNGRKRLRQTEQE